MYLIKGLKNVCTCIHLIFIC